MIRRLCMIAIALMLTGASWAETISALKFEQSGSNPVPEEQLLYNVRLRPGMEFDERAASEDAARLYSVGLASPRLSRDADNGLVLTYVIQLKPTIRRVIIEGNEKFETRELLSHITVFADEQLSDTNLAESANNLRAFYFGEGYYQATVTPIVQTNEDGSLNVIFSIDEHLREKLSHVRFENNTVFSDFKLRYSISNQPWPLVNRFLDVGLYNSAELDNDEARLRAMYHEKGFLDFKIANITVVPNEEDIEYVDLVFELFEGEPYTFEGFEFTGNTSFDAETLAPLVVLTPGKVFNSNLEYASLGNITDFYGTFGYAEARVTAIRRADYENKTVTVVFDVSEGRKYRVEQVDIVGNKITKEKVIRRELAVLEGDPLDTNRVEASRQRLLGMGYFNRVEATTQAGERPDMRRVVYEVEEKDPYSLRIGAGFSDSDSLAGMIEFSNNNFDLFNPAELFRGGGQRFRIQAIAGLERFNFNADFTEPWLFDRPIRLDVSAYGNYVEYDNWHEQRIGIKTSIGKRIFENIDPFNTITLGYKFEYVAVSGVSRSATDYMRSLQTHDLVSQLSVMLSRDTRDNLMEPTSGYQITAFGAISPQEMGSSVSFYRTELRASNYMSFFDKAIIFHLGGQIGVVDSFDGNSEPPVYERYFLGGGETMRGFPFREVSPVDGKNKAVGGSSMLLLTSEVSHPIWSFIRGAVFCDVGNVWSEAYRFDIDKINIGVGYGLRIKVPVINAPIRLDLAYPVLNNVDGLSSKLRFHFNMGFTW